jgi:hypothetical protein
MNISWSQVVHSLSGHKKRMHLAAHPWRLSVQMKTGDAIAGFVG